MAYLVRTAALRADPRFLAPGARTVAVFGAAYPAGSPGVPISNFARGEDYHIVLKKKLSALADAIAGQCGAGTVLRACVDAEPIAEREWAVRAGLGWIGPQGSVVSPALGCCFFTCELLLAIDLEETGLIQNQCGSCRLCVESCPAGAILQGGLIDARRCISYLTIEHKGPIDPGQSAAIGASVFGCDRCTCVCPWNEWRTAAVMPELTCSGAGSFGLRELEALGRRDYENIVRGTPMARLGWNRFRRNLAIAAQNEGAQEKRVNDRLTLYSIKSKIRQR